MTDETPEAPEPRANSYLIGQAAGESAFLDAWASGRLAHAWLLAGPRGIGKATLAFRMARFVLAQSAAPAGPDLFGGPPPPKTLQLSPTDPVFRKVAAQGHPDLRVAERELNAKADKRATVIKVEQIREIISFIHLTPAESQWRVVVVDGADEMNDESANAVLKILEEPPKRSILFLVAHNADRLLPTIRSRCRRLDLRPLGVEQVATLIGRYQPDLPPAEIRALSVMGDGSIGRALELDAQGGVALFAAFIALVSGAPDPSVADAHALAERAMKGDTFRTLCDLAGWWLARACVQASRGDASSDPEIVPGERVAAGRLVHDPARAAEVCQDIVTFARRVEAVNVDKKRSTINMIGKICDLARRRAA